MRERYDIDNKRALKKKEGRWTIRMIRMIPTCPNGPHCRCHTDTYL